MRTKIPWTDGKNGQCIGSKTVVIYKGQDVVVARRLTSLFMATPILRTAKTGEQHTVQLSILNKSDGSASWQTRTGTSVLTSVNGPIEVRIRDEVLGEATLELKVLPCTGLAGTQERYIEDLIRSAIRPSLLLGLHPRSLVQITSQIMSTHEDSTDLLEIYACTINSIVMACVDAGISMKSMLAATIVEAPDDSRHVVCYSYPSKDLIMVESIGPFNRSVYADILTSALPLCDHIHEQMRSTIEEKIQRDNQWRRKDE